LKIKIILSKCKKTSLKLTNQIIQNLRLYDTVMKIFSSLIAKLMQFYIIIPLHAFCKFFLFKRKKTKPRRPSNCVNWWMMDVWLFYPCHSFDDGSRYLSVFRKWIMQPVATSIVQTLQFLSGYVRISRFDKRMYTILSCVSIKKISMRFKLHLEVQCAYDIVTFRTWYIRLNTQI